MSAQDLAASDPMPMVKQSPINITIPLSVASNLDQMQNVLQEVMKQVGCPHCHSGRDVRFNVSSDFVANAAGEVAPVATQSFAG